MIEYCHSIDRLILIRGSDPMFLEVVIGAIFSYDFDWKIHMIAKYVVEGGYKNFMV